MRKILLGLVVSLTSLGGYWFWQHRDKIRQKLQQPGLKDEWRGQALKTKGRITDDWQTELKGDALAGRGDFKDWLVAVKCDMKK